MTFIDYLVDSILILIVVRQVVESRFDKRAIILPLAIDDDGQRVPSWERHIDRLFQLPPASNGLASRDHLLIDTLEPMMHRELLHRCIISEHRGYDSTLIGWVEVV